MTTKGLPNRPTQVQANHASIPFEAILRENFSMQTPTFANNPQNIPKYQPQTYRPQQAFNPVQHHTPIKRIEPYINVQQKRSPTRREVIPIQQNLNPPQPPQRRVEYVPYEQRYVQYVQQRVRVPVQRVATDYYKIEHIIEYMPIEKTEIVYVTQAQEVVNLMLQYVPVQQRIIHMKEEDAKMYGIEQHGQGQYYNRPPAVQETRSIPPQQENNYYIPKTNFVTSQAFDHNQKLKQMNTTLAMGQIRAKALREHSIAGSSVRGSGAGQQIGLNKKESIYDTFSKSVKDLGKPNGYGSQVQ